MYVKVTNSISHFVHIPCVIIVNGMTLFSNEIFVRKDFVIADGTEKYKTNEKNYNKWSYSLRSINQYFVVFMFREKYSFIVVQFKRTRHLCITSLWWHLWYPERRGIKPTIREIIQNWYTNWLVVNTGDGEFMWTKAIQVWN